MTIVIGVDRPDQHSLVKEGISLAEAFEDELHVVHVTELEDTADDIGADFDTESVPQLEQIGADHARDALGDTTTSVAVEAVGLVDDNVARALVEYAADHEARYLVVGGRKRTPVGKALFGSVTQSLLLNADCPVVTLMDDG